jgi:hypothetical protein
MADIVATNPIEIPATEAKVYDKWVTERLVFEGDGINRPMAAEAFMVPGHRKEDGTWDLYPEGRKNIFIPDIWSEVDAREDFAAALLAVQAALEAYGKEKGIL